MASFTSRRNYPRGKGLRYPSSRKLHGPQSRSGRLEKRKKYILPRSGFESGSLRCPVFTSLYRLRLPLSGTTTVLQIRIANMKHNYFMCGHNIDKVAINLLGNTDVAMRCVTTLHRTTVVIKRCAASTERLRTTAVQNDSFFRHTIRLVTDHHYFSCTKSRNVIL